MERKRTVTLAALAMLATACIVTGTDAAQDPKVTNKVRPAAPPSFSWNPRSTMDGGDVCVPVANGVSDVTLRV